MVSDKVMISRMWIPCGKTFCGINVKVLCQGQGQIP